METFDLRVLTINAQLEALVHPGRIIKTEHYEEKSRCALLKAIHTPREHTFLQFERQKVHDASNHSKLGWTFLTGFNLFDGAVSLGASRHPCLRNGLIHSKKRKSFLVRSSPTSVQPFFLAPASVISSVPW
jgi:hypothetical protein